MQALPFGAQNYGAIHVVVHFVIGLRSTLIEADGPDIAVFQLFDGASDVGDARDGHMLRCPGGRFRDCSSDSGGAPLGDDDSVGARSVGGAKQSAQIVGIFYSVENEKERPLR